MGLFNLFKKNSQEMTPRQYSNYRKQVNSFKEDGTYDFEHLNKNEKSQIMEIVEISNHSKIHSLEFYRQSVPVVYKNRYILFQIIISKYQTSDCIYDKLAVGLAYETKGAYYRPKAISFMQEFIDNATQNDWLNANEYVDTKTILTSLAVLYEKEYDFDKAVQILSLINNKDESILLRLGEILKKQDINACVEFYKTMIKTRNLKDYKRTFKEKLDAAIELQKKNYIHKPRKNRAISKGQFDDEAEKCALTFIPFIK